MKIWGRTNSINVQKVMWTVGELGLDHERIDVGMKFGGLDTEEYGRKNPNRLIPVLEEADGRCIWESHTIVRYLASAYGEGRMSPQDTFGRAEAEQWMDWKLSVIQPEITPLFWGLIRKHPDYQDERKLAASALSIGRAFSILDAHLADRAYVCGDDLTIGDVPVGAATWRYFNLDIAKPDLPNVQRWFEALKERPAYQQHVMIPLS